VEIKLGSNVQAFSLELNNKFYLLVKIMHTILNKINLEDIKNIALEAGKAIIEIYEKDFHIEYKNDKSPLTEADIKSNNIICSRLEKLYSTIPILSEENREVEYKDRKDWEYYWCIDPIDGTKEFIKKNGEFTVNIALIYKKIPVLGVVYAPALDLIYSAKKDE
jgi:3'(2'), 5'-bisphosphate nucleotidase